MVDKKRSRAAMAKKNFKEAAAAMWADDPDKSDVQVLFGAPGQYQAPDIVAFTRVSTTQDPATLSTNRSREEVIELDVMISCFRGGAEQSEEIVSDRAYDLLADLTEYVQFEDTTLGGLVRECFLIREESVGYTSAELLAAGRCIEITATFQAKARVTR